MGKGVSTLNHADLVVIGVRVNRGLRRYFLAPRDAPIYEELKQTQDVITTTAFDTFPVGEGVYVLIGDGSESPLTQVGVGGEMSLEQVHSVVQVARTRSYQLSDVSKYLTARDLEAIFQK